MATAKQQLGSYGESVVTKFQSCPMCKRASTLRRLPPNFKCADIICDFCGFLAQVKTTSKGQIDVPPSQVLGAAWGPQKERMTAGIYFPLYIVVVNKKREFCIYYVAIEFQTEDMFIPREPLSHNARRAGWQGFRYDLTGQGRRGVIQVFDSRERR